jgi:hypothetical protein
MIVRGCPSIVTRLPSTSEEAPNLLLHVSGASTASDSWPFTSVSEVSCKCPCLVYLEVRGEVAERLKAAVC